MKRRSLLITCLALVASCSSSSADDARGLSDVGADLVAVADTVAPSDQISADLAASAETRSTDQSSLDAMADVASEVAADAEQQEFPLGVGDKVPEFELPAHDGSTFKLSDVAGKKLLISSYPLATTGVCTWQTCFVNDNLDQFTALNTVPVGMSTDTLEILAQWAADEEYKQRLLSDTTPKGAVSAMLGIYDEGTGLTLRANTIIDETGKIIFQRVYGLAEKPAFAEIFDVLENN